MTGTAFHVKTRPAATRSWATGDEVTHDHPVLGEQWHGTVTTAHGTRTAVRWHSYTPAHSTARRPMTHASTVHAASLRAENHPVTAVHAVKVVPGARTAGQHVVIRMQVKGAFDDARHPRDRDGKFIEIGRTVRLPDGTTGKITGLSGRNVDVTAADGSRRMLPGQDVTTIGTPPARDGFRAMKAPLTDAQYDQHTQMVEQRLKAAVAAGKTTDRMHTLDPAGEIYTPERARMHKEIVDDMMARAAHIPDEGKGIIAGGLGGAGKTTVLTKHSGIDTSKYLTLNPDDVKEEMARRGMIPHVDGLSPMEASPLAHEEASRITNMAAKRAYEQRKNVLWDITMSSHKSAAKRIDDMHQAGYQHVHGVFVDIPAETSVQRALARHRRGMERFRAGEGNGGRYVPPAIIRASAGDGPKSANRAAFDALHSRFDKWDTYDNSVHGRAPVHIAGGGTPADDTKPPWTVAGDTAHFRGSLNIDRSEMPQLSGTIHGEYVPSKILVPKFMQLMQDRGVPVTHETVPARSLKPVQTSGSVPTIEGIADSLRGGATPKPIIISSDNRVIDGHHTWGAAITAGRDVPVIRVGLPAKQVLSEMRSFNTAVGIAPRATGVMANPAYARQTAHGRNHA